MNSALPNDWRSGRFLGRLQTADGPSPVLLVDGRAFDMARIAPTAAALVETGDFSGAGGIALLALDAARMCTGHPSFIDAGWR